MFMSIKSNARALEKKLYPRICGQGEGHHVEATARSEEQFYAAGNGAVEK